MKSANMQPRTLTAKSRLGRKFAAWPQVRGLAASSRLGRKFAA
jgi:hypothetical protein